MLFQIRPENQSASLPPKSGVRPPWRLQLQPINSPGRVEGLKSAATSRSLGNRGYLSSDFILCSVVNPEVQVYSLLVCSQLTPLLPEVTQYQSILEGRATQGPRALREPRDREDSRASRGKRGRSDPQDLQEPRAGKDRQGLLGRKVPKAPEETPVGRERLGPWGTLARRGNRGEQELLGNRERQGSQV